MTSGVVVNPPRKAQEAPAASYNSDTLCVPVTMKLIPFHTGGVSFILAVLLVLHYCHIASILGHKVGCCDKVFKALRCLSMPFSFAAL